MVTLPDPLNEAVKILIAGLCLLVFAISFSLAILTSGCDHQAHPAVVPYNGPKPLPLARSGNKKPLSSVNIFIP